MPALLRTGSPGRPLPQHRAPSLPRPRIPARPVSSRTPAARAPSASPAKAPGTPREGKREIPFPFFPLFPALAQGTAPGPAGPSGARAGPSRPGALPCPCLRHSRAVPPFPYAGCRAPLVRAEQARRPKRRGRHPARLTGKGPPCPGGPEASFLRRAPRRSPLPAPCKSAGRPFCRPHSEKPGLCLTHPHRLPQKCGEAPPTCGGASFCFAHMAFAHSFFASARPSSSSSRKKRAMWKPSAAAWCSSSATGISTLPPRLTQRPQVMMGGR